MFNLIKIILIEKISCLLKMDIMLIYDICGTHVTLSNLTNMIIVSEIDHLDIIDYDYNFFYDVAKLNK